MNFPIYRCCSRDWSPNHAKVATGLESKARQPGENLADGMQRKIIPLSITSLAGLICRPRWLCVALALVLLAATVTRVALSVTQFSHVDDIGVAVSILQTKSHPPTIADLLGEARAKQGQGHVSPRLNLLFALERWGQLDRLYAVGVQALPYVIVPLTWTYAPLQFVATAALITPGENYQLVKFLGRLPSVLLSVLSLILIAMTAPQLTRAGAGGLALWMVSTAAFSGEHTTLAALMHYYAAAAVASTAILYLTARDARLFDTSWPYILKRSAVLIVLCYLSYQTILLLPGYFLALAIGMLKARPLSRLVGTVWRGSIFVMIVAIGYLPAYVFRVSTITTIHYNAGPNNEFAFAPGGGLLSALAEAPGFLLSSGWVTVKSLVSPVSDDTFVAGVVTAVVLIGLAVGLWRMIALAMRPRAWTSAAAMGVLCAVSIALFIGLVLDKKLAFGPTRHVFIYLPIILLPAAYGVRLLVIWSVDRFSTWKAQRVWLAGSLAWTALLALIFYAQAGTLFHERRDTFDENRLRNIVQQNQAELVISYGAPQLFAMPSVAEVAPIVQIPSKAAPKGLWEGTRPSQMPRRIVFVSQNNAFNEKSCAEIREWIVSYFHVESWTPCLNRVDILDSLTIRSDVEVEFSRLTKNGTNSIYVSAFELPAPKQ